MIGGIILAAGSSTRMGTPKQLLKFRDCSFLRHAAQSAVSAGLDPIVVVLGAHVEMLHREVDGLPVHCVTNHDWEKGIGTSIRCGIGHVRGNVDAVAIMLCDQPLVDSDAIRLLIEAYRTTGSQIIASQYNGVCGVPALFAHPCFEELASLPDSVGAKVVIEQSTTAVRQVALPSGAIDIDTPTDYQHFVSPSLSIKGNGEFHSHLREQFAPRFG